MSLLFVIDSTETDVRKLNVPANTIVSLTLWDIPGREDMDLHKTYFRNLDAAIGGWGLNFYRFMPSKYSKVKR